VQTYTHILRRLGALAQLAFTHILKYLFTHTRPPKVGDDFTQSLPRSQMASQNSVVKVLEKHASQRGRHHPSASPSFLWKIAQQPIMDAKIAGRSYLIFHLRFEILTEDVIPLMFLKG
jgi:hypothetical protein